MLHLLIRYYTQSDKGFINCWVRKNKFWNRNFVEKVKYIKKSHKITKKWYERFKIIIKFKNRVKLKKLKIKRPVRIGKLSKRFNIKSE